MNLKKLKIKIDFKLLIVLLLFHVKTNGQIKSNNNKEFKTKYINSIGIGVGSTNVKRQNNIEQLQIELNNTFHYKFFTSKIAYTNIPLSYYGTKNRFDVLIGLNTSINRNRFFEFLIGGVFTSVSKYKDSDNLDLLYGSYFPNQSKLGGRIIFKQKVGTSKKLILGLNLSFHLEDYFYYNNKTIRLTHTYIGGLITLNYIIYDYL